MTKIKFPPLQVEQRLTRTIIREIIQKKKKKECRDFPGSLVIETAFSWQGGPGSIPVREMRTHRPCGVAKK